MNRDILLLTIGAIFSFVPTLILEIIRYNYESRKDKRNRKNSFVDKIYDYRLNAYIEMFKSIIELRELYNDVSTDFLCLEDHSLFDPNEKTENLKNTFLQYQIYFKEESVDKLSVLVINILIQNDLLPINGGELAMDNKSIVEFARDVLKMCDDCITNIRDDIGLSVLDNII